MVSENSENLNTASLENEPLVDVKQVVINLENAPSFEEAEIQSGESSNVLGDQEVGVPVLIQAADSSIDFTALWVKFSADTPDSTIRTAVVKRSAVETAGVMNEADVVLALAADPEPFRAQVEQFIESFSESYDPALPESEDLTFDIPSSDESTVSVHLRYRPRTEKTVMTIYIGWI